MLGVKTRTSQGERETEKEEEEMKSIRGRIIKELKSISISTLTSLNPSLLFQHLENSTIPKECDQIVDSPDILEPEIFKDVQEGELVTDYSHGNGKTESKITTLNPKDKLGSQDLNEENGKTFHSLPFHQTLEIDFELLREFEEKCPPGGSESVVFYTTSFRGIRKTFEDCSAIRFLLDSFRVAYEERDISMDLEYREELWKVLDRKVVPPRLFIRGRHIGGADEVVGLHEQGLLRKLLQGIPLTPSNRPCSGCAGVRFVLCLNCNGSRKVTPEERGRSPEAAVRCLDCNENGLMKGPVCS